MVVWAAVFYLTAGIDDHTAVSLYWNPSLTPGRSGHQDHLQQQKDQEELHLGLIFRKNARPVWSEKRLNERENVMKLPIER